MRGIRFEGLRKFCTPLAHAPMGIVGEVQLALDLLEAFTVLSTDGSLLLLEILNAVA